VITIFGICLAISHDNTSSAFTLLLAEVLFSAQYGCITITIIIIIIIVITRVYIRKTDEQFQILSPTQSVRIPMRL
jgi:uncharacterized membrane protein (DUF485 family)